MKTKKSHGLRRSIACVEICQQFGLECLRGWLAKFQRRCQISNRVTNQVSLWIRWACAFAPLFACSLARSAESATAGSPGVSSDVPHFESEIRPILREFCLDCHGATNEPEGALDLRLVRFMLSGGDSGPAIQVGSPEESQLIHRVTSGEMPPGQMRLKPEHIELLRRWIQAGALTQAPEPESIGPGIPITQQERQYWAYRPLARPEPANFGGSTRVRTELDALIAQSMPAGVVFSPDASRTTLIRRVHNDLLGLPPTAQQTAYWLSLPESHWYETMIDTLLDSPHYGQRWARHWLDAAGYADSDGSALADAQRAWAWRYRDYVIDSFNADKPFDQFITEQLAGDELAGPANGDWTDRQIELLTATGFLRMAADGTGSGDNSPEARNKTISDTLQIIGSTLFASSLQCAQCHDHRYDPISHRDYFALRAIFEPALDWQNWKTPGERLVSLTTTAQRVEQEKIEAEAQVVAAQRSSKESQYMKQALEKELSKHDQPLRGQLQLAYETPGDQRTAEQKALLDLHPSINISPGVLYQYLPEATEELTKLDAKIVEIRAKKPSDSYVHALVEPPGHLPVTKLFHRGDHNQPTEEVAPGGLSVLSGDNQMIQFAADDVQLPTSGRRLALARWLTDRQNPNPLLARSMVNRIWLHHFGRGIVATPGDFGRLGSQPTHPEVLDWLAWQWIDQGWSVKHLHRLILTSTVFRQSSQRLEAAQAIDPENHFYWRKPLLRVDAEVLRDTVLAMSGDLSPQWGGPPTPVLEDEAGQVRIDPAQPRRSIFASWRRSQPVAMLQAFDAPVMNVNCEVRSASTVAPQALMLMNGEFILDQSAKIAKRCIQDSGDSANPDSESQGLPPEHAQLPNQIVVAWQRILQRSPTDQELQAAIQMALQQLTLLQQDPARVPEGQTVGGQLLTNLCQVLLCSNEFLYID